MNTKVRLQKYEEEMAQLYELHLLTRNLETKMKHHSLSLAEKAELHVARQKAKEIEERKIQDPDEKEQRKRMYELAEVRGKIDTIEELLQNGNTDNEAIDALNRLYIRERQLSFIKIREYEVWSTRENIARREKRKREKSSGTDID